MVPLFEVIGRGGLVVCSPDCPCVDSWSAEGMPRPVLGSLESARDQFWAHLRDGRPGYVPGNAVVRPVTGG